MNERFAGYKSSLILKIPAGPIIFIGKPIRAATALTFKLLTLRNVLILTSNFSHITLCWSIQEIELNSYGCISLSSLSCFFPISSFVSHTTIISISFFISFFSRIYETQKLSLSFSSDLIYPCLNPKIEPNKYIFINLKFIVYFPLHIDYIWFSQRLYISNRVNYAF